MKYSSKYFKSLFTGQRPWNPIRITLKTVHEFFIVFLAFRIYFQAHSRAFSKREAQLRAEFDPMRSIQVARSSPVPTH